MIYLKWYANVNKKRFINIMSASILLQKFNNCIKTVTINYITNVRFTSIKKWLQPHLRVISTNILHSIGNGQHLSSFNSKNCRASKRSKGHTVWNSFLNNQCVCSIFWHFEGYLSFKSRASVRPQQATELPQRKRYREWRISLKINLKAHNRPDEDAV